jgi:adenylate cyclase class IV
MPAKTNLELKRWCGEFSAVRKVLAELGATRERETIQTDYFFNLPVGSEGGRLKLRQDDGRILLIYYLRPDFCDADGTASQVQFHETDDEQLLPLLKRALGVLATVSKRREVWRKADTVFHLDTVERVGGIFEIEMQKDGDLTADDRALFAVYEQKLLPHLGAVIAGSNLDLVLNAQAASVSLVAI